MSELMSLQDMANGHLDVKALGEAANGDENTIVTTRTGETYPSAKKAIKTMFENGGLPATPFPTKALMTASPLVDGKYAMVTDDAGNNGLYVKTAGAWVKSAYDPLGKALAYTDKINASIFSDGIINIPVTPIIGYSINVDTPAVTKFSSPYRETRSYLQVDLDGCKTLTVRNSIAPSQWRWVFRDKDDVYISMTPAGVINADFDVPANAKWAYRTFGVTDANTQEGPSLSIKTVLKNTVVDTSTNIFDVKSEALILKHDTDLYGGKNDNLPVVHISGAVADTAPTKPTFLAPGTGERKHMVFNVKDYSQLTVSGDPTPTNSSGWYWVLEFADGSKQVTNKVGNTTVVLPPNTIRAYRTTYYKLDDLIVDGTSSSLTVTATPRKKRIQPQIDELSNRVGAVEESVEGDASNGKQSIEQMQDKMTAMFERGDVVKPNDFNGNTQTERLKNAIAFIKTSGMGILEIGHDDINITDTWLVTEALTLPSNCWIYINNVTVKKAPKVFDNVFRNDGIVVNPDPFGLALELIENRNIRIFGNDKTLSKISGNMEDPHVGVNPVTGTTEPFKADVYGWRCFSILFANTNNYHVYNLSFDNVTGWTISNEHGCDGFSYHDLIFDNRGENSDGVDIRMGCSNFEIYNIEGTTKDDMVACTAINGYVPYHPYEVPGFKTYIYPAQVGGYIDRGFGVDINNASISNITGDSSNEALLLLATNGSKVGNITVSNIKDRSGGFIVYGLHILGSGYGVPAQLGDIHNITIRDVNTSQTKTPVRIAAAVKDVWVNNVSIGSDYSEPAVVIISGFESENFNVTNCDNMQNIVS